MLVFSLNARKHQRYILLEKNRRRILSENKISKYLLYAIGEIILVVIGILITVQIDNGNLAKQRKTLEVRILSEILVDDMRQVDHKLVSDKVGMDADTTVIAHIRAKAFFNDSITSLPLCLKRVVS